MIYETAFIVFLTAFAYWLGCKRTQVKHGLLSIMTPKQYRSFTEVKLYFAKVMIAILLFVLFWMKHHPELFIGTGGA